MGHGKPGKSWNFMISFSRPGKSWNLGVGQGKSCKMILIDLGLQNKMQSIGHQGYFFWKISIRNGKI